MKRRSRNRPIANGVGAENDRALERFRQITRPAGACQGLQELGGMGEALPEPPRRLTWPAGQ